MKTTLVLLTLVTVAAAASVPLVSRTLKEDLHDFFELLPRDELGELAFHYFTTDQEFEDAFIYLKGEEFSAVWDQFFALREVNDVLNYLQAAGLDVYEALNFVADFLEKNHVYPVRAVRSLKPRGISEFVDEALALLPKEELRVLFKEKLQNSPEFKAFYEKLHHADFYELVELYNNSEEVQGYFQKLRDHGIDVDKFFKFVAGVFGWGKF